MLDHEVALPAYASVNTYVRVLLASENTDRTVRQVAQVDQNAKRRGNMSPDPTVGKTEFCDKLSVDMNVLEHRSATITRA
jgi:hypothetical protein